MNKYIFGTMILIGFLLMLFTAGASDLNTLTFTDMFVRVLIGLGLVVVGFKGMRGVEREKGN